MVTEANLEKVNNVSGNNVNKKCNTYWILYINNDPGKAG
jgi:hypothetical protein